MRHTPGPWHIGMKPGPMIYGPKGEHVADMRVLNVDDDEHRANRRLILAAPNLLAALESLVLFATSSIEGFDEDAYCRREAELIEEAQAAIAEAYGEGV